MAITTVMPETTLPVDAHARTTVAAAAMDEETFRAFYERTSRPVWAYLKRITGDANLADDLLQDTYYRFVRANAVYDNESHRRNSLFRIATNLARDSHRRTHGALQVPLPDDLETAAARHDERTDLTRALNKLKPLQREILWLAYGQGSSYAEIAEVVGVSSKSIKSLLFRARRKLAELLRD